MDAALLPHPAVVLLLSVTLPARPSLVLCHMVDNFILHKATQALVTNLSQGASEHRLLFCMCSSAACLHLSVTTCPVSCALLHGAS